MRLLADIPQERSARGVVDATLRRTRENKWLFDRLAQQREEIEARFGDSFEWLRLDDKKASRIVFSSPFDGFNESVWPEMVAWLCDHIVRLETAFSEPLSRLNRELKSGIDSATADGAPQADLAAAN